MSVARPGKNQVLAYVLWFFLGTLGVHRFYVGSIRPGIYFLVATIVAIALSPINVTAVKIVAGVIGLGILVFWIIDAFKLHKLVKAAGAVPSKTNE